MSALWKAIEAAAKAIEDATGVRAAIGIPDRISAGMCGVVVNEIPVEYELGETGGSSDSTAVLSVYDCVGVTGSRSGDAECVSAVSDHIERFKELIEDDTTLGGAVQEARLYSSPIYAAPSSDNSYEAFTEIKLEVTTW